MVKFFLTSITLGLMSFASSMPERATASATPTMTTTVSTAVPVSGSSVVAKKEAFENHVEGLYDRMDLKRKGLSYEVFRKAVVGVQNFKQSKLISPSQSILSVVDFTKPSSEKRLWIINLKTKKVLFNTLVAHGRNTGQDKANQFSNTPNSYMSSLGFYITDAPYYGKHGLSLRMKGMDEGFNTNAMARAIVVHGADYVSEKFVKQNGRLGRSLGCPSIPTEISDEVINLIKNKSVFYIHGNDSKYTSRYLNDNQAVETYAMEAGGAAGMTI
ncbi:murein L,D-transpeptidase catalytic domain family protein [Pontibacter rugosus]|uniref:Murein L,D-transpeptidase catalytic domain family protein n=1 Tax=Pontibacter rugosus TaxID=1745966 RepID=A0ABW3SVP7_9BACT